MAARRVVVAVGVKGGVVFSVSPCRRRNRVYIAKHNVSFFERERSFKLVVRLIDLNGFFKLLGIMVLRFYAAMHIVNSGVAQFGHCAEHSLSVTVLAPVHCFALRFAHIIEHRIRGAVNGFSRVARVKAFAFSEYESRMFVFVVFFWRGFAVGGYIAVKSERCGSYFIDAGFSALLAAAP